MVRVILGPLKMTDAEMQLVQKWISNGGELLVGSNHSGDRKIKVRHGPFHIFTSRFSASEPELQALKDLLANIQSGQSGEDVD